MELTFIQDPGIDEINCGRQRAAQCTGLPLSEVVGFRPPFLEADRGTYDALHQLDFLYFSSNPDSYSDAGNSPSSRVPDCHFLLRNRLSELNMLPHFCFGHKLGFATR